MQQRRLRLGDIVDDYCPRERRITNHAVVAMIEDEVRQTRCSTCDTEHEYKQARVPAQRRRKDAPAALAPDLLAAPRKRAADEAAAAEPLEENGEAPFELPAGGEEAPAAAFAAQDEEEGAGEQDAEGAGEAGEDPPAAVEDDGPVHRPLFRAKLPRPDGQLPERKLPDFTIHQRDFNGNRGRPGQRRGPRPGQARGQAAGPSRFGGQRQGPAGGQGQRQQGGRPGPPRSGQGQGQPGGRPNRHGGGRKRGR